MIELLIALAVVMALGAASLRADRRFRKLDRLPMQWSLTGEVNWTAPRRIALAFTPALATVILSLTVIALSISGAPRPGQEGLGAPVVLVIGIIFLFVHMMHLRLIDRSID